MYVTSLLKKQLQIVKVHTMEILPWFVRFFFFRFTIISNCLSKRYVMAN